jgi:NAD(P)-dependent dehydrogenase (short-subunit alcohol dehydrogenase family)
MSEFKKRNERVAIVTGGAGGIGKAICKCLIGEGAKVVMADLSEASATTAIGEINSESDKVTYHRLEVTDEESWKNLYKYVEKQFNRLDILVNNAGIYLLKNIEETTLSDWQHVMNVNATGVFLGTKLALPLMRTTGSGSIVNNGRANLVPRKTPVALTFMTCCQSDKVVSSIFFNKYIPALFTRISSLLNCFSTYL